MVYSWNLLEPPVPAAPPLVRRDIEDDGIEAQAAPSLRVRAMPDDPAQPWSRNYGRTPPAISASEVYRHEADATAGASRKVASSD